MENISAKLEVYGIGNYSEENYKAVCDWLVETAKFIEENRGKFDDNFTANRFFAGVDESKNGTVVVERKNKRYRMHGGSYGRDPFPPRE